MAFLRRFARTVTVLHEGKVLCEGSVADVQSDDRVREVYLGRSRDERSGAIVAPADVAALEEAVVADDAGAVEAVVADGPVVVAGPAGEATGEPAGVERPGRETPCESEAAS